MDIATFEYLKEKTKELTGALSVRIECTLNLLSGKEIAWSNTIHTVITNNEWSLIQNENGKLIPEGLQPSVYPEWQLERLASDLSTSLSDLRKNTTEDPFYKLMYGMTKAQIDFLKDYLQEQPDFKELFQFKPAIEIANLIKIKPIWALAAMLLSSVEGFVKLWLVNIGKYDITDLERKYFNELVRMMEKFLKDKNV
jgi:hypothetical protein